MNKGKKQQAKELYYQSDLTKTEIANTLGISRQALHYWIKVHNWDKMKESAAVLPSLLAQKCYHIIGHLTDSYLDEMRAHKPVTLTEAETLYKLTLTIRKLKQHSTMCETMEVFKDFNERLAKHNKKLAKTLSGYMERYFTSEAIDTPQSFQSKDYNEQGRLIHQTGEIDIDEDFGPTEKKLDERDLLNWTIEKDTKGYVTPPPVHPTPPVPPPPTGEAAPAAAPENAPPAPPSTGETPPATAPEKTPEKAPESKKNARKKCKDSVQKLMHSTAKKQSLTYEKRNPKTCKKTGSSQPLGNASRSSETMAV